MADETPKTASAVAQIPRTTRPMSEALLNEKVQLLSSLYAHRMIAADVFGPLEELPSEAARSRSANWLLGKNTRLHQARNSLFDELLITYTLAKLT